MKFNSTFEKSGFFCISLLKSLNFFLKWNFFEMLCLRWIWIFEHVCLFDKLFRHQIFFSLWIVRSNFIIFFLSLENVIWKITSFEFSFFRSIWKCDVINQKRIFDDVATSYLTDKGQTRTRSVIRFEEWCWMNIIFTWWRMIQSESFSSFKKHIRIFISFVFFFRQIFFNQWFLTVQIVKFDQTVSIIFKNIKKNNFSNHFSQYSIFQFLNRLNKVLWRRFCEISIERICCCSLRCRDEARFSKF